VKRMEVWHAEAGLVTANIALIKEYAKGIEASKVEAISDGIRLMEADRDKAIAKSAIGSNVCYEFSCLFTGKSHPGDHDNGEVSDNFDQTCAGFFAKVLCLLLSAFFITLIVKVFATTTSGLAQRLGLLMLAPFILILGFGFRKELELPPVKIIGLKKGVVDVAHYLVTGKDKYQDQKIPASTPERSPIFKDKADGRGMQTPESPTSQKLSGKNKPDGTAKYPPSSTASSEDSA
jgi:hypothetical protein